MKKKAPQAENHERWLVSYADLLTLLFAFFVVMFASSQTDKAKAKQMSEAVQAAFEGGKGAAIPPAVLRILGGTVDDKGQGNAMMKGPGGAQKFVPQEKVPEEVAELLPSLKRLTVELQAELKAGQLEMHLESRGLVISLREAAFFPSGDDEVAAKSYPAIDKLCGVIKDLPNPLSLEGHTDAIPIHNARFHSNWELSAARGIALLKLLHQRYGITEEKFSVVGYADTKPLQSNDTAEGRARNRRVDIVVKNMTVLRPPSDKAPAAAAKSH